MIVTLNQGYPDYVGRRFLWCGYGTGPTSYVPGGDPVTIPGLQQYIDSIDSGGCLSVSGTYYIRPIPSGSGARATWKVKIIVAATNAEVSASTNLSTEIFPMSGKGGRY